MAISSLLNMDTVNVGHSRDCRYHRTPAEGAALLVHIPKKAAESDIISHLQYWETWLDDSRS